MLKLLLHRPFNFQAYFQKKRYVVQSCFCRCCAFLMKGHQGSNGQPIGSKAFLIKQLNRGGGERAGEVTFTRSLSRSDLFFSSAPDTPFVPTLVIRGAERRVAGWWKLCDYGLQDRQWSRLFFRSRGQKNKNCALPDNVEFDPSRLGTRPREEKKCHWLLQPLCSFSLSLSRESRGGGEPVARVLELRALTS